MRNRFERQRMLGRTAHAEEVGHAAQCEHQGIESQLPRRQNLAPIGIVCCADHREPLCAIDAGKFTLLEFKAVALRLHRILKLMRGRIDLSGRGFMQQRLPEVSR